MTTERIKEIHQLTAYPQSISVQQALLQVWNECERESKELREQVRKLREWLEEIQNLTKKQMQSLRKTDVSGVVALLKFLKEEQQKQYADANDYMSANQYQYYEEGLGAVLKLIETRFGN